MKLQFNKSSKVEYQGQNQATLLGVKKEREYKADAWVTFLQARELGLKIKKGSKGVAIFKGFGQVTEKDKKGKTKTSTIPMGWARVFNLDCTEKRA